jgi:hypothetical protein
MALLQQQQRLAAGQQRQRAAAPAVLRSGSSCRRTLLRPLAAAAPAKAGLIDGKKIAEDIRKEIAAEVQQLQKAAGRAPGLAVVLVGARKDSETYVRSKKKACAEVGFESFGTDLPEDVSQEELLKVVAQYNADPKVSNMLRLCVMTHVCDKALHWRLGVTSGPPAAAAAACTYRAAQTM